MTEQMTHTYRPTKFAQEEKLLKEELFPSFLTRAKLIVQQRIGDETFGVMDLSAALHLSPSQVYRKIKKETQLSPSVFIRQIRLQWAHELIINFKWSISAIAYQVGFNKLSYFSRCFSNYYGVSPSQLRKNTR